METIATIRLEMVQKWATKYGLDPVLVCAVVEQETGGTWDPFTTRNEDAFYARYINGKPNATGFDSLAVDRRPHARHVIWTDASHWGDCAESTVSRNAI